MDHHSLVLLHYQITQPNVHVEDLSYLLTLFYGMHLPTSVYDECAI